MMKKFKNVISVLLAFVLVITSAVCGVAVNDGADSAEESTTVVENTEATEETTTEPSTEEVTTAPSEEETTTEAPSEEETTTEAPSEEETTTEAPSEEETTTEPISSSMLEVYDLKYVSSTDSSITVTWSKNYYANSYLLLYSEYGSNNWRAITTVSTICTIKNLKADTPYQIKATGYNGIYGYYSPNLIIYTKSKSAALTATSVDANNIKLSWEALSGASTYDVQYYSSVDAEWQVLPGGNNLTERTFTDTSLKSGRQHCGYLYRVVGRNSLGDQIGVTKTVTGTTKGLTVTQDDYSATISWDSIANVKNYSLLTYVKNLGSVPFSGKSEFTGNSVTLYLSPEDIHSFTLIANYKDNASKVIFSNLSVQMPTLDVNDSSDKGVNAKLLYLERAINKTKYTNDDIRVKYDSVSDYEIYYLKSSIAFIGKEYNGTAEVQKFFDKFNDGSDDPLTSVYSEVINEDISFRYGSGKNSKGKVVALKYILEPTTNSDNYYLATIYDAQNPANWKNGFSKVDVKENADGSYEFNIVLKKETFSKSGNSKYHNGLFESVGSLTSGDDAEINNAIVGETTIKAEIGADGILKSYEINSSFDEDTNHKFIDIGTVNIKRKSNNKLTYTFTK